MAVGAPRTLKGRALQLLAQREHSRVELRRKLLGHVQGQALAEGAAGQSCDEAEWPATDAEPGAREQVEVVLNWLEAQGYLSAERFAESRVNARASRFGNLRIRQELKQHDVALSPDAARALKDSELNRARAVRSRRFSSAPNGVAELSRQVRFLSGRGFSPDVIRQVLREDAHAGDDAHVPADTPPDTPADASAGQGLGDESN